jgi:hypothetical protein
MTPLPPPASGLLSPQPLSLQHPQPSNVHFGGRTGGGRSSTAMFLLLLASCILLFHGGALDAPSSSSSSSSASAPAPYASMAMMGRRGRALLSVHDVEPAAIASSAFVASSSSSVPPSSSSAEAESEEIDSCLSAELQELMLSYEHDALKSGALGVTTTDEDDAESSIIAPSLASAPLAPRTGSRGRSGLLGFPAELKWSQVLAGACATAAAGIFLHSRFAH